MHTHRKKTPFFFLTACCEASSDLFVRSATQPAEGIVTAHKEKKRFVVAFLSGLSISYSFVSHLYIRSVFSERRRRHVQRRKTNKQAKTNVRLFCGGRASDYSEVLTELR